MMLDRSTLLGLLATVALIGGVMLAGAGASADVFWRVPSVMLVLGGAVLTSIVAFPGARFRSLWPVVKNTFYVRTRPADESIITLLALADLARRDGILALEKPVEGLQDDFLKRAMQMAVDGYDAGMIRNVMETELECLDARHAEGRELLESMGRSAPTFGMIGTLIGLVIMLGGMDDPSRLGPGMAVALLTTLYGLVVAHVFCLPLARKLTCRSREELLAKTIALEGVLSIQAGDHPRVVAQKLRAFLPPDRWGSPVSRSVSEKMLTDHAGDVSRPDKETETHPRSPSKHKDRNLVEAA